MMLSHTLQHHHRHPGVADGVVDGKGIRNQMCIAWHSSPKNKSSLLTYGVAQANLFSPLLVNKKTRSRLYGHISITTQKVQAPKVNLNTSIRLHRVTYRATRFLKKAS